MFSILIHKATHGPKIFKSGMPCKQEAIRHACNLYEASLAFLDHQLLVSGVCIVVMADDMGAKSVASGALPIHILGTDSELIFLCGGY